MRLRVTWYILGVSVKPCFYFPFLLLPGPALGCELLVMIRIFKGIGEDSGCTGVGCWCYFGDNVGTVCGSTDLLGNCT